ncbi:hypothetical protein HR45_13385 [Shewanella mangrovi]|uniref:Chalcone isomerase domain-containing protein n=1 Tax=Shewanella mangrovi TaxID=1515746 RepID=A0A094JG70_9GAMM|nr:chalcone isomerase family protein [Shewanella mangrovi]KFZ37029.1 hypothetical protein HR45_13385 [Shewanella mangrovi]
MGDLVRTGLFACLLMLFPAQAEPMLNWRQWPSVGNASLSWLWFDIYHSTLRTPDGVYLSEAAPLALQIQYLRNISAQELLDATREQWQKLGYSKAQIEVWLLELSAIFPSVEEGDQLVYVSAGEHGRFYFQPQGQAHFHSLGHISESTLNRAFIAIWLSPQTAYPKLRRQLIGAS